MSCFNKYFGVQPYLVGWNVDVQRRLSRQRFETASAVEYIEKELGVPKWLKGLIGYVGSAVAHHNRHSEMVVENGVRMHGPAAASAAMGEITLREYR